MKQTIRKSSAIGGMCGLLALGGIISGCGGGSGGTTGGGNTTRLVATWDLVKTSGGFAGNGYPVTPGMETLTFNQNGTFTRTISGQTTSGTYKVTQRKTSLSTSALPVITYNTTDLPDVVSEIDDLHLVTSEEAADGFSREYERVVQTAQP